MSQKKIPPVDTLVTKGFNERFQQVFDCSRCAFVQANDKTKILERLFGQGKPLTFPYAYFVIRRISYGTDTWNPHQWARRGIIFAPPESGSIRAARMVPADFEIEVTYVTDKFDSVTDQGSVRSFVRRWMLAHRAGYLKFNIQYGRLMFRVGATLAKDITIPERENVTDNEIKLEINTSVTLHAYVSDPAVVERGFVEEFLVTEQIGGSTVGSEQRVISTQVFQFPKKE